VTTFLAQPGTPWERLHWITTQVFPGQQLGRRPDYFLVVLHALTNEDVPEHVRERAAQQGGIIYGAIRQLIVDGQATIPADQPHSSVQPVWSIAAWDAAHLEHTSTQNEQHARTISGKTLNAGLAQPSWKCREAASIMHTQSYAYDLGTTFVCGCPLSA